MTFPGIEHDPTAAAVNQDMVAVEQLRQAREAEYGEYVAVQDIPWGTVKAATPGMRVPTSTVKRLKWDELGLVAKRTSKAGRQVLERTGAATTEELERWKAEDKAAAERAAAKAESAAETASADQTTGATRARSTRRSTSRRTRATAPADKADDQTPTPADAAPATTADKTTEGGDS